MTSYTGTEGRVVCCSWSSDPNLVATGGGDRKVHLWNPLNGDVLAVLGGHGSAIKCVDFCRDGTRLVSSSEDRTLRIWELAKQQVGAPCTGGTCCLAFSDPCSAFTPYSQLPRSKSPSSRGTLVS